MFFQFLKFVRSGWNVRLVEMHHSLLMQLGLYILITTTKLLNSRCSVQLESFVRKIQYPAINSRLCHGNELNYCKIRNGGDKNMLSQAWKERMIYVPTVSGVGNFHLDTSMTYNG